MFATLWQRVLRLIGSILSVSCCYTHWSLLAVGLVVFSNNSPCNSSHNEYWTVHTVRATTPAPPFFLPFVPAKRDTPSPPSSIIRRPTSGRSAPNSPPDLNYEDGEQHYCCPRCFFGSTLRTRLNTSIIDNGNCSLGTASSSECERLQVISIFPWWYWSCTKMDVQLDGVWCRNFESSNDHAWR